MKTTGNLAVKTDEARQHILFHHKDTDGWIAMARKDPITKRFQQYHYKIEDLLEHLSEWMGEDVYFSQGSFYKPQRRIDNIRQLRSLYVDLDVYNLGLKPEWVLAKLEHEYFRQAIPEPNMIIFSGRGLVLIWNIQPIPHMALPLWRAVETFLADSLKDLGADTKATDPARIFRLAGSINSKNSATVTAQYRHEYRYDIHDLQFDYLPELTPAPAKVKKPGRKSKVVRLFNIYTLHLERARDIAKLVELRRGEVNNYREYICFLYRYFTCCYTSDPQRALDDMLDLNSEFTDPLPYREVHKATKSAQEAWEAKSNAKADELAKAMGYPGAGYNLKNSKIIEWLNISPQEQMELSTIIGPNEKRRRKRVQYQIDKDRILKAKEEKRRAVGVKSRTEYLSAAEQKRQIVRDLLSQNPDLSIRAIVKQTGISKSTVQRIKADL